MKPSKPAKLGPQTQAIHGGEPNRRGVNGPIVTEIIRSSTFTFSSTEEMKLWAEGKNKAYIYTRYGNPTLSVAEKKIAALEGAEAAVVTSSGMAAISSALLAALKAGDEVITTAQTYGGTYRLMRDVFPNMGITVRQVGTRRSHYHRADLRRHVSLDARRFPQHGHYRPSGRHRSRGH